MKARKEGRMFFRIAHNVLLFHCKPLVAIRPTPFFTKEGRREGSKEGRKEGRRQGRRQPYGGSNTSTAKETVQTQVP